MQEQRYKKSFEKLNNRRESAVAPHEEEEVEESGRKMRMNES